MKHAVEVTKATRIAPQKFDSDSLNLIYLIGESCIKSHSHLYGYNLPTTPYLDEERRKGNLFVFEDVVTAFNHTSETMKNTLCCNSLRNDEKWSDYPYFPSIFKKAGYDVFLWDSQYTGNQAIYEFSLQSFMYNKQLCEQSYTQTSQRIFQYDGETVDDFSQRAKASKSHCLIMFHLIGQHIDAASRYPHEQPYEKFKASDIKWNKPYLTDAKRQKVAEYDNATLYNDAVVKRIIDLYRDKNTVILYFSDHGDEVYDYRDSQGRVELDPKHLKEGMHSQYDVPFMIWCSDKYMERNPDIVRDIKQSLRKPFRTDDICQVVFHLARLRTEFYRPKYDLLSPSYVKYKRTLGNGMAYDK